MRMIFAHDHIFYKYNDSFYSNGGLSAEVLKRYTNIFEEVSIVSRQEEINDISNKLTLASIEKVDFIKIPNFKSLKDYHKKVKANKIIENEVKEADCVISRLPSSIGNIAIKYAEKYDKPYLVEVVGCAWDSLWNYGNIAGKIFAPYSFLKTRRFISKSEYTIYITKEFLQSRYPSYGKACICPNVNIKQVSKQVLDNRVQKINNKKDEDVIVFGLVGSLDVSYKGHETVIKAFSLIKDKIPKFRIEFLGKGNPESWVSLVKECGLYEYTKFLGTLPSGDEVYNWMDSIDVSLQPSSAEAQGRCIIEAMSRGCPVIASKVGGIVELIDHDWLINSGDYFKLSEKIIELIRNKEMMKQQAKRNFKEAEQYYKDNIEFKRKQFLKEFRKYVEKDYKT